MNNDESHIQIHFTPTIPHCSMATLIGLCIRVKLLRSLPDRFKVDINITPGTHASEAAVNKQLNDKERVAAALENASLIGTISPFSGPLSHWFRHFLARITDPFLIFQVSSTIASRIPIEPASTRRASFVSRAVAWSSRTFSLAEPISTINEHAVRLPS